MFLLEVFYIHMNNVLILKTSVSFRGVASEITYSCPHSIITLPWFVHCSKDIQVINKEVHIIRLFLTASYKQKYIMHIIKYVQVWKKRQKPYSLIFDFHLRFNWKSILEFLYVTNYFMHFFNFHRFEILYLWFKCTFHFILLQFQFVIECCGFKPWMGQTKYYIIGICGFHAKAG